EKFFSLNLKDGNSKNTFRYIKNNIIGDIISGKFNDDDIPDFLISEKNHLRCLDGITLKQLWEKEIPFLSTGVKNILYDRKGDIYIVLPLYNGKVKVLNKYGADVFELKLNENLVHKPVVFKNKNYLFIQRTINNNIYAFEFEKRKNIWSVDFSEKIVDVKARDLNFDDVHEIFVLTSNGMVYILNSETGKMIDSHALIKGPVTERVVSALGLDDIDNDNNIEISFATDQAGFFVYKYILFHKKFILKKYLQILKKKWKLIK
ncbi:MAG: PQQ-like beta-propeller repeat protein, partial [Spirochaetes bacterium]|nr:PQQ-like beta-propeller repeat protein [Spirochaetota bacterium]